MGKCSFPPLKMFRFLMGFESENSSSLSKIAAIEREALLDHSNSPRVLIPSYKGIESFPLRIAPLTYQNPKNNSICNIYSDAVEFIYETYSTWSEMKRDFLTILKKIISILEIKKSSNIYLYYLDEFKIEKASSFQLNDYFHISLNLPESVNINYDDFNIAFRSDINETDYEILRLKSSNLGQLNKKQRDSNTLVIQLENNYVGNKEHHFGDNCVSFEQYLDAVHDTLEHIFVSVLTEKMKKSIGWVE